MTLEELAAHAEIQQVLYRYCRGVDRGDAALISAVYHPGAIDEHGAWVGAGRDFAAYLVPAMDGVPLVGQHHITNILIELDGDAAQVESYFIALHPETDATGAARHAFVCGRYLDRFERRDGLWLIAHRKVILDVARSLDPADAWRGAASFPAGARQAADPSSGHFARAMASGGVL